MLPISDLYSNSVSILHRFRDVTTFYGVRGCL